MTFIKKDQAKLVDLGNKVIRKYIAPDKSMEINYMTVTGRNPENPHHFLLEKEVQFMMYVIKGTGTVFVGDEKHAVEVGDVIHVPKNTKFAIESENLEYLAAETPAFYPEQAYIVDSKGTVVGEVGK